MAAAAGESKVVDKLLIISFMIEIVLKLNSKVKHDKDTQLHDYNIKTEKKYKYLYSVLFALVPDKLL